MSRNFDENFLNDYLDGNLTGPELARAEKLMAEDPSFREQVESWRAIAQQCRAFPKVPLPQGFADQIVSRAFGSSLPTPSSAGQLTEEATPSPAAARRGSKAGAQTLRWMSVAALAASLVLGVFWMALQRQRGDLPLAHQNALKSAPGVPDALAGSEQKPGKLDGRIHSIEPATEPAAEAEAAERSRPQLDSPRSETPDVALRKRENETAESLAASSPPREMKSLATEAGRFREGDVTSEGIAKAMEGSQLAREAPSFESRAGENANVLSADFAEVWIVEVNDRGQREAAGLAGRFQLPGKAVNVERAPSTYDPTQYYAFALEGHERSLAYYRGLLEKEAVVSSLPSSVGFGGAGLAAIPGNVRRDEQAANMVAGQAEPSMARGNETEDSGLPVKVEWIASDQHVSSLLKQLKAQAGQGGFEQSNGLLAFENWSNQVAARNNAAADRVADGAALEKQSLQGGGGGVEAASVNAAGNVAAEKQESQIAGQTPQSLVLPMMADKESRRDGVTRTGPPSDGNRAQEADAKLEGGASDRPVPATATRRVLLILKPRS